MNVMHHQYHTEHYQNICNFLTAAQNTIKTFFCNFSTAAPKETEGFKDTTLLVGQKLELTSKITGIPAPEILWFKDGQQLKQSKMLLLTKELESYVLIKDNISLEDEGTYTIKASNIGGSIEVSAKVTVLQPPQLSKELDDTELIEGEPIKFHVTVIGVPTPEITWLKDSAKMKQNDDVRFSLLDGVASLELLKTNAADTGNYSIIARNALGEAKSSANLAVFVTPTLTDMADQTVIAGDTLMLQSKITGIPTPRVTWLKNNEMMVADENILQEDKDGITSIQISKATVKDEGKYSLKIENKAGKAEKVANINVLVPPSFKETLHDETLLDSADLHFQVIASGKPSPSIQWFKDGSELKTDKRSRVTSGKDTSTLLIKKVDTSDSGRYSCFLQNDAGNEMTEATVTVNSKPQVLKKLKDTVLNVRDVLRMETEFKGTPEPEVKWYRNDEIISDDKTKKEGNTYFLHIDNVHLDDMGVYSVVAQNIVGDCKTSAKVKIVQGPHIVKPLTNITLVEKETLVLEAEIQGTPDPDIEWLRDGRVLSSKKSGSDKVSMKKKGNSFSLNVSNMTFDNQGIYCVRATNQAGEVSCQATVVVQGMFRLQMDAKDLK